MKRKNILAIFLTLAGLECLVSIYILLSAPASESNQILYTFSLPQILFSTAWLCIALACFYCAWGNNKHIEAIYSQFFTWIENPKITKILLLAAAQLLLIAFVAFFFISPKIWGGLTGYLIRLRPFVGWVILVLFQFIIALVLVKKDAAYKKIKFSISVQKMIFFFILGILCSMWIFISITGFGAGTNDDPVRTPTIFITYYELCITLLITAQVWLISQFGKLLLSPGQQGNLRLVSPLLISLIIWTVAVLVWTNEPMRSSYYRIGPFPPNGDYVPASDPTRFDLPGQLALIGRGLNSGDYIDNPFYVFAVMIFRAIGGQYYERMIFYQILVLALIPVIYFLIGRIYLSHYLGIVLAVLTILREKNIIFYSADTWLSPVKALLTEPFITLLLAGFCLFMIKWLKDPGSHPKNLVLAGGLFGLSTLVRTNPWFLLPLSVLVIFLRMRFRIKPSVYHSIIFGAAALASILPWMIRSQQTIYTPFYFLYKMQHSVVEERYGEISPNETEPGLQTGLSSLTQDPNEYSIDKTQQAKREKTVTALAATETIQAEIYPSESPVSPTWESLMQTEQSGTISGMDPTPGKPPSYEQNEMNFSENFILFRLGEHFVFNFVNTVQILPTLLPTITSGSPVIFPATVFLESKQAAPWRVAAGNISFFFILAFLAGGISYNFRHHFLAGIFPIFFYLTYGAGIAVAMTSASRYTQPIEWVILLYFCIGLLLSIHFIAKPILEVLYGSELYMDTGQTNREEPTMGINFPIKSFAPILLLFLIIGAMLPLSDIIFPEKYQIRSPQEILQGIDVEELAANAGMTNEDYLSYTNLPATWIIEGRLIYAQYYRAGEGEDISRMREVIYDYPRITFELIGPYKATMNVLLPYEEPWPDMYLNGKTAIVIGCSARGGIDALSVILPEEGLYLSRTPNIKQQCR